MRRLLVRHPAVVGLLAPADLTPALATSLRALAEQLPAGPLAEEITLVQHWLAVILNEKDGCLSISAVAALGGTVNSTIEFRLKRLDGTAARREGRMLALPPPIAARLVWPRLLLSAASPPARDGYLVLPLTREVLSLLSQEWHSLLAPPPLRELGRSLVAGAAVALRGDQIAGLLNLEAEALQPLRRQWEREPPAVRVVRPARTLAATTFAGDDLVRLWWNRCVALGAAFDPPLLPGRIP